MTTRKAVFLDRDGTLNEDTGYPPDFPQVHIYPAAFEAVRRLGRAGFATVVVTHQSGIGRGYFDESDLEALHGRFLAEFARRGPPSTPFTSVPRPQCHPRRRVRLRQAPARAGPEGRRRARPRPRRVLHGR